MKSWRVRQVTPMSLSDSVLALEQENERLTHSLDTYAEVIEELRTENEQLKSQSQETEAVKKFLDLMQPTIANVEQRKGNPAEVEEQIAAFRVVRPK